MDLRAGAVPVGFRMYFWYEKHAYLSFSISLEVVDGIEIGTGRDLVFHSSCILHSVRENFVGAFISACSIRRARGLKGAERVKSPTTRIDPGRPQPLLRQSNDRLCPSVGCRTPRARGIKLRTKRRSVDDEARS